VRFIIFIETLLISSAIFLYLQKRIKIHQRHLYIDNIYIIAGSSIVGIFLFTKFGIIEVILIIPFIICILLIINILWRFLRDPLRRNISSGNEIISPADGQVIYINEIKENNTPISIKKGNISKLEEITKTDILSDPCYIIGIVMTLFDVHVNRSPIDGVIELNKHTEGKYLSLKSHKADTQNERNTIVINNKGNRFCVVQIASKGVRRIISYVKEGQEIKKGQKIGRITMGSQVDIIIPRQYVVNVQIGQQIFAGKSIIAKNENID
jgi:phosphatidylserine decarboxylase